MRVVAALGSAAFAALVAAGTVGVLPSSLGIHRRTGRRHSETAAALQRSGLMISPTRLHVGAAGTGILAFAIVYGLSGIPVVAAAPALLATALPRWWVARRAAHRHEAVQRAWPDAIRDLVASISAGLSLQHALERLGDTGPAPLRPVFARFTVAARAAGVAAALEAVRDDLGDATSDRVVEILLVAHERGGPMVPEILRDLAAATTRDLWVLEQIQTESLEQRINARAVFALPWIVLVAITLQDGPFRAFYRSGAGLVVIVIGAFASGLGMMIIRRLGAHHVEPRVLGGNP